MASIPNSEPTPAPNDDAAEPLRVVHPEPEAPTSKAETQNRTSPDWVNDHIVKSINFLMRKSGQSIEVRAPNCKINSTIRTVVSRFKAEDVVQAARCAESLSGRAPGVYILMNGVDPTLPTGTDLRQAANGTNVRRRLNLPIDFDCNKPDEFKNSMTSKEEMEEGRLRMLVVKAYLAEQGWPEPMVNCSGGGWHLVYAIDLPNDDTYETKTEQSIDKLGNPKERTSVITTNGPSTRLLQRVLKSLNAKFGTDKVKIDPVLFDAPRLIKAHGTLVCKGENLTEIGRVHRRSGIVSVPEKIEIVPPELLEAVADLEYTEPELNVEPTPEPYQDAPETYVSRNTSTIDPTSLDRRVIAYLDRIPGAISGQKGHNQTYKACCNFGPGFDLSQEAAFRYFKIHYNPKCKPEWTDGEIAHKIQDAYANESRRGWLLNADRPGYEGKRRSSKAHTPPPEPPVDVEWVKATADKYLNAGDFESFYRDERLMTDLARLSLTTSGAKEFSIIRTKIGKAKAAGFRLGDFTFQINILVKQLRADRRTQARQSKGSFNRSFPRIARIGSPTGESPGPEAEGNHDNPGSFEEGPDEGSPEGEAGQEEINRVEVLAGFREFQTTANAITVLSEAPNLFVRGPVLVKVIRTPGDQTRKGQPQRKAGTPKIERIGKPFLRNLSTRYIKWMVREEDEDGIEYVEAHPPNWAIEAILDSGEWPGIRSITGITECPVLRPDGTILQEPGWDKQTGLLYEPNAEFLPVAENPTLDDAKKAVEKLYEVVCDFPFAEILTKDGKPVTADETASSPGVVSDKGATQRAALLAALLTPLGRQAIAGPTPVNRIDSNTSGSGKSKLCDYIAILATGRHMARMAFPTRTEEQEKVYLAIALAGDPMILWDNVANGASLGGAVFDMSVTADYIQGRILGLSETAKVPFSTVQYATGNNLGMAGDGLRRILPIRLNSPVERPEERTDFKFDGDLLDDVMTRRPVLIHAALTILRAFTAAGSPTPPTKLTPMDFPAWCSVIRNAVYWVTGYDPCATRVEMIAHDSQANDRVFLIEGLAGLPGIRKGLSARAIVSLLDNDTYKNDFGPLRDVMAEWSRDGDLPSPKVIGVHLKAIKGKVIGNKVLDSHPYQGTQVWKITDAPVRGSGGSGGSPFTATRAGGENKKVADDGVFTSPDQSAEGREQSHNSHDSHESSAGSNSRTFPEDRCSGNSPQHYPPPPQNKLNPNRERYTL